MSEQPDPTCAEHPSPFWLESVGPWGHALVSWRWRAECVCGWSTGPSSLPEVEALYDEHRGVR